MDALDLANIVTGERRILRKRGAGVPAVVSSNGRPLRLELQGLLRVLLAGHTSDVADH